MSPAGYPGGPMSQALPLARPDDPRLDGVIRQNLGRFRIDDGWTQSVRDLATGTMSPRGLRCCGSGCRPCVQDVLRCTAQCLMDLQKPSEPPPPGGPFGGRGRLLARRIAARLRGAQDPGA
jgi:hypothetical protein